MFGRHQTKIVRYKERCDTNDLLHHRINLLNGKDKLLMTMYLEKGNSFRQIAKLAGVHETLIARRIHKITARLLTGEYIICLRNSKKFNVMELDIAKEHFLAGLSLRKIARKRGLTYYRVRKILRRIRQINSDSGQFD
jgi:predicted DNA-binding protein YlxM (UPF0122 family)